MTAYTTTNSFDFTSPPMMYGVVRILLTREPLVTMSCFLRRTSMEMQTVQLVQILIPFCMPGYLVHIMQTCSILGLGCETMRHGVSISYGCDGMSSLILHLQDGVVLSWTPSASLLCTKLIPLASWIRKISYVGAILFQPLRRANDIQTRLEYHAALKIVMTTCYITSAGVLGARVIWQLC
jgi:hypothetical protein